MVHRCCMLNAKFCLPSHNHVKTSVVLRQHEEPFWSHRTPFLVVSLAVKNTDAILHQHYRH